MILKFFFKLELHSRLIFCLAECEGKVSKAEELEMPVSVSRLLYGPLAPVFIAETISACREINTSSLTLIIDMLVKVRSSITRWTLYLFV